MNRSIHFAHEWNIHRGYAVVCFDRLFWIILNSKSKSFLFSNWLRYLIVFDRNITLNIGKYIFRLGRTRYGRFEIFGVIQGMNLNLNLKFFDEFRHEKAMILTILRNFNRNKSFLLPFFYHIFLIRSLSPWSWDLEFWSWRNVSQDEHYRHLTIRSISG